MSLLTRIFRLEQAQGAGRAGGVCACHGALSADVRITDEEDETTMAEAERPPRRCDECGRERRIVIIRLVSGPNPHATLG